MKCQRYKCKKICILYDPLFLLLRYVIATELAIKDPQNSVNTFHHRKVQVIVCFSSYKLYIL